MKLYFIIAAIQALFLRSMDEGKPLYKLKAKWYIICPEWLKKPTVECDECISLWLSVISMGVISYYDWRYILSAPLVMILTYLGYKLLG